MLEVSGIRIHLTQLDGGDERELALCKKALAKKLRVNASQLRGIERRRRSIDARKKADIVLTFTLRAELAGGPSQEAAVLSKLTRAHAEKGVRVVDEEPFGWPDAAVAPDARPVVV